MMIKEIHKEEYPENLKQMHRSPKRLYMHGSWPDLKTHKFLCIIGSRHPTKYGKEVCGVLIKGLTGYPISIISGLAIGIDSLSHEIALDAGLHCIAFPGSGLNERVIYPESNRSLAKRITDSGGALLSEYKPEHEMRNWMFPARNRLMAGLAHAILIIEAGKGSGTLKTAEYGVDFNRDMMGVVGSIFSPNSYGPHMLIRDGATPVFSSEDVLRTLGFAPRPPKPVPARDLSHLDALSRRIIDCLFREPMSLDNISMEIGIPISELNVRLTYLEIDNLIKIEGGLASLT